MMVDFGLPYRYAAGLMDMAGRSIDVEKVAVKFGRDVNLANVLSQDILEMEAWRVGLGVVGPQARRA
jgi:phosphosulfolactate synthase (CoM biosynthesis protein A)